MAHRLVDFDGTLVKHTKYEGPDSIGEPIEPMVERVKGWLEKGQQVRIFTARVSEQNGPEDALLNEVAIKSWCLEHLGKYLPVTNKKSYDTIEIWDDRAVGLVTNTGYQDVPDSILLFLGYMKGALDGHRLGLEWPPEWYALAEELLGHALEDIGMADHHRINSMDASK